MPARYTDDQKLAALDKVDGLIADGSSVNKALKQVSADTGIAAGTIRGWRSKLGRAEPVGDRKASARGARQSLTELVDRAIHDHIEAGIRVRQHGLDMMSQSPDATKFLMAANAMIGTAIDKGFKRGTVESAADRVEVTTHEASPLDQLATALDRLVPSGDADGDA